MSRINRRRVLISLAGGAAVAGVSHAISKDAFAAPVTDVLHERPQQYCCWILAQQGDLTPKQRAIDFWSMQWARDVGHSHSAAQAGASGSV